MGISSLVLDWFCSHLSGRSFCVEIGNYQSASVMLKYRVPQGSVLGPLLFSINMLPLSHIIKKQNISYHFYADDTQLYLSFETNDTNQLDCVKFSKVKLRKIQDYYHRSRIIMDSHFLPSRSPII